MLAGMADEAAETRSFTLEEANALVDELRAVLEQVRDARRVILNTAEHLRRGASANGGGADGAASLDAMATVRSGVEALTAKGIILRDADTGLIDFPTQREGRLVYLCWRLGEDRVTHWHEVESGFGGRKPI